MVAALLLLTQAPTYGLPADPILDRPLAIEARIEPLPELLTRISKELGVPLSVERRMEGLKATVFTPTRSVRLTLAGLASVFDAEWTRVERGGYRLAETVPARNRREAYLELEDADRRARVKTFLQGGGLGALRARSGDSKTSGQAAADSGFAGAEAGVRSLYQSLAPLDREKFWQGEPMHYIGEFQGEPPEDRVVESGRGFTAVHLPAPAGRTLLLVRTRRDEGGVRFVTFSPKWSAGSWQALPPSKVASDFPRSVFRKAQDAWGTNPRTSSAPELQRALTEFETVKPPWARSRWTDTDVLETLHRASGIPVVAEAFRRWRTTPTFPTKGTLRDALRRANFGDAVRCENGSLLHRPWGFWSQRLIEPPEAAFVPLETASATPPEALLDAAAETYAALPRESLNELWRSAARRDLGELEDGRWALRLWGRLSPKEREMALTSGGLALAAVGAEARTALSEAVLESIFGVRTEFLHGNDSEIGSAERDPRAQRVEAVLKLLGLTPAGSLTLRAERSVRPRESGPYDPLETFGRPLPPQKGLALRIADVHGYGLRLFAPEPSVP